MSEVCLKGKEAAAVQGGAARRSNNNSIAPGFHRFIWAHHTLKRSYQLHDLIQEVRVSPVLLTFPQSAGKYRKHR